MILDLDTSYHLYDASIWFKFTPLTQRNITVAVGETGIRYSTSCTISGKGTLSSKDTLSGKGTFTGKGTLSQKGTLSRNDIITSEGFS